LKQVVTKAEQKNMNAIYVSGAITTYQKKGNARPAAWGKKKKEKKKELRTGGLQRANQGGAEKRQKERTDGSRGPQKSVEKGCPARTKRGEAGEGKGKEL